MSDESPAPPPAAESPAPKSGKWAEFEQRLRGGRSFRATQKAVIASSRLLDGNPANEDTLYPPRHAGRTGLRIIALTLVALLALGSLAPIESAAISHGKVGVLSHRRTVQHLEGGIISQILVKEGDLVTEGQPLLVLDNTQVQAANITLQTQLWSAQAAQARLEAERDDRPLSFPAELVKAKAENETLGHILNNEEALYTNRRSSAQAQRKIISLRARQIQEQIDGTEKQMAAEERKRRLLAEEVSVIQGLLDRGLAQKSRLLALKRAKEESDGAIGKMRADIAEAKQRLLQSETELLGFNDDLMRKISEELRENQEILVRKEEESRAKKDVLQRVTVRAPAGGVVTAMKYFTVGGVVAPGTPIMDIVPQNDTLVIDAQLSPTDIDIVHPDLTARVMLTAYKARTTPWLRGKVTMVSPDTVTEQAGQGTISYYRMQVIVDADDLDSLKDVTLYPGMPADVYVITGERTFLGYLLQPITDSMHKAFREQ